MAATVPDAEPFFMFECHDIGGHKIYIMTDGNTWESVKCRFLGPKPIYKVAQARMNLTKNDQFLLTNLIRGICEDATQG